MTSEVSILKESTMEQIKFLIDLFLHLDEYMAKLITDYGTWTYAILFLVIFMETGFVVTPFLPGDSLLFAAGTFAALGSFNVWYLILLLIVAAILGDAVNYSIGRYLGERAYNIKWIKKEYLEKTHAFFEKHGGKAIFLARFVPIVRTFAPFVAGIGKMSYSYFATYNVVGGVTWVVLFTLLGYGFGNACFTIGGTQYCVRDYFEFVIVAIILISVVPMFVEWWKARREAKVKVVEA